MNYSRLYYHKTVDTLTGQCVTEPRTVPHIPVKDWPEWANYLVRLNNGLAFFSENTPKVSDYEIEAIGRIEHARRNPKRALPELDIFSFIDSGGMRRRRKFRYTIHCRFDWERKNAR